MVSSSDENTGKRFGRYKIITQLATGGMAQIYKAETSGKKVFTLKRILDEYSKQSDFIKMFLEEAKLSLSLNHPNIVRTLDLGQFDGSYYLAMEYVYGRDLGSLLRNSVEKSIYIPIDVACHIILQCCRALDYAHSRTDSFGKPLGLVHRDISPPNIMISYNGESKILDFGIAKAVSLAPKQKTRSGVLKGKFCYMSPEQAQGNPLDLQSDLFSLAIVLHELLTSKSLFFTPDEIDTLERVRRADVHPPSRTRKGIPKELDKIVLKALDRKKSNRYESCAEFGRAIRKFLNTNYPRSDARTVAKFVRGLFREDFQNRYDESVNEGWKDILVSGASDDELILNRTAKDMDDPSVRVKSFIDSQDIPWIHRVLYDPKISAKFVKYGIFSALLFLLVAGSTYVGFSKKAQEEIKTLAMRVEKVFSEPLPTGDEVSLDDVGEVSPGRFAEWKKKAGEAQERGDLNAALHSLDQALEINPFETELLIRRNFIRMAQGQYQESCRWFEIQTEISKADKLLSSAICEEIQGEEKQAFLLYSDFLKRFPNDPRSAQVNEVIQMIRKKAKP